jgi:N-methylhydantoinase A/oxoprolinase/acetone carboxylase beta subunit
VFDRYALYPAHTIVGPAIVEEREATTLILPGDTATVSPAGHLTIAMGDAP